MGGWRSYSERSSGGATAGPDVQQSAWPQLRPGSMLSWCTCSGGMYPGTRKTRNLLGITCFNVPDASPPPRPLLQRA